LNLHRRRLYWVTGVGIFKGQLDRDSLEARIFHLLGEFSKYFTRGLLN